MEEYTLIQHNALPYLVPCALLNKKPEIEDFYHIASTPQMLTEYNQAINSWLAKVEPLKPTPALLKSWGYKVGFKCEYDIHNLRLGRDFKIENHMATVL